MITVNAIGDACPLPVVKTKKALENLAAPDMIEVLVDNETAVKNVTKFVSQTGKKAVSKKIEEGRYQILIDCTGNSGEKDGSKEIQPEKSGGCAENTGNAGGTVVVISSDRMGEGKDELGKVLMKGFLFALTQLDVLPEKILFYNGGAQLTCEGSDVLKDLEFMQEQKVEILTCGTCLDYYGLKEKLKVGSVTNMYTIVETMAEAGKIIKP